MRIGSLFSGAGGLDMAVQAVFGGDIVWHSEVDPAASKVLAYRFPGVPNLGDITKVDWADVPAVDVLCGGFPCQDVSAAGKRAGIKDGTRSGLWAVFAEAIDALRPQWVVVENVRGLLSATAHRTVEDDEQSGDLESGAAVMGDGAGRPVLRAAGAVLGDLCDLGYDAQWATVSASSVGAPHRRERIFIVAHTSGAAVGQSTASASAEETGQSSGDRSGDSRGERTVADGRQACGCGDRRIDHDWFANPDRFDDGGCRRCRCENFYPASDSSGVGWDEGRPEPARLERGFDAAVGGDEPGVALLPTPRASDPANASSHSSEGFRPQLGEVVRQLGGQLGGERRGERGEVVDDDGAVPVLPTDGGGVEPFGVALNGDGVAVDVSGCVDGHNACVPVELAGTKPEPGVALLPTPNAQDGGGPHGDRGGWRPSRGSRQSSLSDALTAPDLLTTPRSSDCFGAGHHGDGGMDLRTTVIENASKWGKYSPAITRWEAIVGPAPAPTEPNKNGNPRLSAAFSEWLMGWPAGWVTDPAIGISRNDQLRILGNGVVPAQAAAALRFLLAVTV